MWKCDKIKYKVWYRIHQVPLDVSNLDVLKIIPSALMWSEILWFFTFLSRTMYEQVITKQRNTWKHSKWEIWFTAKKGEIWVKSRLLWPWSFSSPLSPIRDQTHCNKGSPLGQDKCVLTIHLFFVDAAHNSRLQTLADQTIYVEVDDNSQMTIAPAIINSAEKGWKTHLPVLVQMCTVSYVLPRVLLCSHALIFYPCTRSYVLAKGEIWQRFVRKIYRSTKTWMLNAITEGQLWPRNGNAGYRRLHRIN